MQQSEKQRTNQEYINKAFFLTIDPKHSKFQYGCFRSVNMLLVVRNCVNAQVRGIRREFSVKGTEPKQT